MQNMSTTNGKTIYHSNNRFWKTTNQLLQVKHIQTWNAIFANISANLFHIYISSATKCFIAFARKNDGCNFLTIAAKDHTFNDFLDRIRRKSVAIPRTVNGYLCYSLEIIELYFFKFFNGCPVSHICIFLKLIIPFSVVEISISPS